MDRSPNDQSQEENSYINGARNLNFIALRQKILLEL